MPMVCASSQADRNAVDGADDVRWAGEEAAAELKVTPSPVASSSTGAPAGGGALRAGRLGGKQHLRIGMLGRGEDHLGVGPFSTTSPSRMT